MKNIVITGGAGFIGSHVACLFVNKYPKYNIINLNNLKDVENVTSGEYASYYANMYNSK